MSATTRPASESLNTKSDYYFPRYSVKQASELTGLTLNQVRLWERRYKLVSPERASNGYRLYSRENLDILRYARQETQKGVSIHVIAEQVRTQKKEILKQLRNEKRITPRKIFASDPRRLPNYDLMVHSVANGDPMKFERLLIQAQAGKSFSEAVRTVDLPILARIGELTMRDEINISASHLASAVIRRRILAHVQNLGVKCAVSPVLLACVPDDYHELGLLCCMLELTQQNHSTLYLGPNVPLEELFSYSERLAPRAVLMSLVAPMSDEKAKETAEKLSALNQQVPVALGGFEANKRKAFFESYGLTCFKGVEEVLDWDILN